MKVLKEGRVDNRWVGQCGFCRAILMADTSEINVRGGGLALGVCPECDSNNEDVRFNPLNSSSAKILLRSNNLKTLYKKEDT